jgi:class 3 adenylate cyclase
VTPVRSTSIIVTGTLYAKRIIRIDGEGAALTIEDFLSNYPWDTRIATGGSPMDILWEFQVPVDRNKLWKHLIDTSRFNRALGLPQMYYVEKEGQLHGETVNAGFAQVWVEDTWQWISGQNVIGGRRYSKGFSRYVRVIYDLSDLDDGSGTCVRVYFGWIPRGWFGRTILKLSLSWLKRQYSRVLEAISEEVSSGQPQVYVRPNTPLSTSTESRLGAFAKELSSRQLPGEAISTLLDFVRTADDIDAYRLRVSVLALSVGIHEDELLKTCLHATRLGLLRISWDLMCPHCRGARSESFSLNEVVDSAACEACGIEFKTDNENSIEVTFQIHPSIRTIPKVHYCAAEPATKRHIKLQQKLDPGETKQLTPTFPPSRYRIRVLGERGFTFLDIVRDKPPSTLTWQGQIEPDSTITKAHISALRAGVGSSLKLTNPSHNTQIYIIEEADWTDLALRPHRVFNSHEFRDLFAEESLRAGVGLSVGNQTILFTDVIGSTKLYADSGDPKAYAAIKAHFDQITPVIKANRGVLVKTIGDATMAAFSDPVDALKASRHLQRIFSVAAQNECIKLRISLNLGPCIAVNLNTGIDYFGTTVNLSAKLQRFAETGDIAFSQVLLDAPEVRQFLEDENIKCQTRIYESKDFKEPIPVYIWNVHDHMAPP